MLDTAKAEPPPPEGSTAITKWRVFQRESSSMMSTYTAVRLRLRKASTSADGKARCEPSEAMPMDSRSLQRKMRSVCQIDLQVESKEDMAGRGTYSIAGSSCGQQEYS